MKPESKPLHWIPRVAYLGIIGYLTLLLLMTAKTLVAPLAFAVVFSTLVQPIVSRLSRLKLPTIWAVTFTYLLIISLIVAVLIFFSNQIVVLFSEVEDFQQNLNLIADQAVAFVNGFYAIDQIEIAKWLLANKSTLLKELGSVIGNTVYAGSELIGFLSLMLVFSFFISLYQKSLVLFALLAFGNQRQDQVKMILVGIRSVIRNYFQGMLTVMVIIGVLNTIGLSIIGIEYAFLFGFLASFMTIIPYVGTTLGYTVPFLFALISYPEALWKAIAVVGMTVLIQQLEANFITPNVVGNKVSINAFIAFLALIIGGLIWGIAGMILSIPTIAIVKVILEHVKGGEIYAHLLSQEFPDKPLQSK